MKQKEQLLNTILMLSEQQQEQIWLAIQNYIKDMEECAVKRDFVNSIQQEDVRNKLVIGFADILTLSKFIVFSLRKNINVESINQIMLEKSKDDLLIVQELKVGFLNKLLSENFPKQHIDPTITEKELIRYRKVLTMFKKDYIYMFDTHKKNG